MTEPTVRVCPRCGSEAHQHEYCQTCGLHLTEQPELPTRGQWQDAQAHDGPRQQGALTTLRHRWASVRRSARIGIVAAATAALLGITLVAAVGGGVEHSKDRVGTALREEFDFAADGFQTDHLFMCSSVSEAEYECINKVALTVGGEAANTYDMAEPDLRRFYDQVLTAYVSYDLKVDDSGCYVAMLTEYSTKLGLDTKDQPPDRLTGCLR